MRRLLPIYILLPWYRTNARTMRLYPETSGVIVSQLEKIPLPRFVTVLTDGVAPTDPKEMFGAVCIRRPFSKP
jgi:hypothetical protein